MVYETYKIENEEIKSRLHEEHSNKYNLIRGAFTKVLIPIYSRCKTYNYNQKYLFLSPDRVPLSSNPQKRALLIFIVFANQEYLSLQG